LATALFAAACGTPREPAPAATPAASTTPASTTAEVLARHQQTFGGGDLEGVLADYAPDAVIFTPNGIVRGSAEIRSMFQTLLAEWGKPGTKFELRQQIVDGPNAYMFWNAETADNVYEGATDGFVIQNGKIAAHFFAGKITPKAAAK
jgi:ketosteroid isomerase-like protein